MDATFRELAASDRTESIPLSHLSLELGHLDQSELAARPARLRAHFEDVAPWAETARKTAAAGPRARVSTCLLIDDYFDWPDPPASVIPYVLDAARSGGIEIDYVARESGCVEADKVPVAGLLAARLVALPTPGTNGSRPPALEVGWLSNGQRSPCDSGGEAMRRQSWTPPAEISAINHSVFVDVELWSEKDGQRTWSCAYLASVWQLLRLGLLRDAGANVVHPKPLPGKLPDDWNDLPAVMQVNPKATPFCAYRTLSMLPTRFLPIEQAVRVILEQVAPLPAVLDQINERSTSEDITLPLDLTDRIGYLFFGGG